MSVNARNPTSHGDKNARPRARARVSDLTLLILRSTGVPPMPPRANAWDGRPCYVGASTMFPPPLALLVDERVVLLLQAVLHFLQPLLRRHLERAQPLHEVVHL